MKKLGRILVLLLVLLGLTACADPIDPSRGGENAFLDNGVVLNIGNISGADTLNIDRRNVTKGEKECRTYIQIRNLNGASVVDYFVNPGDTYEYKYMYYKDAGDQGWEWLREETKTIQIKAEKGVGELKSVTRPVANYDPETSIMTFTTMPKFSDVIEQFVNSSTNCNKNFFMWYNRPEQNESALSINDIKESFNCANYMWDESFFSTEDKQISLPFGGISACVNINGVNYSGFLPEGSYDIPKEITVKDTRAKLTFKATNEGIKIIFPDGIEGTKHVNINRFIKGENGEYENDQNINIYEYNGKNEVIDYFVDSNKKYKYQAYFSDDNWNNIVTTKLSEEISSSTTNNGELKSTVSDIKGTYDEKTGVMTFDKLPVWPDYVNKLVNNPSPDTRFNNYKQFKLVYYYPGWGWTVNTEIQSETDLSANINEQHIGKELKLSGINALVRINDVEYSKLLPVNCPETVVVPDTRISITAKDNLNGIEINLPKAPEGTEYFTIGRQNVNYPTDDGDMLYWYINCQDKTKQSVVDYFVTPGQKYEYTVHYRTNNNGNIIKESKPVQFTAVNGIKENFLDPSTTVSYNENTGIMKVSSMPDFSKIEGILNSGDWFEPKLLYRLPDNSDGVFGVIKKNGEINWCETLIDYKNGEYLGKQLTLESFQMAANIGGVNYNTWYNKEDLKKIVPTIPDTITVPDNRAELTLTPTTDGIKIIFPKGIEGTKYVSINRFTESKNGKFDFDQSICIKEYNGKNEVIDYFVDSNKKYKYQAYFSDDNWNNTVTTKLSEEISLENTNYGELKSTVSDIKGTYDEKTGVMSFDKLPNWPDYVNNLVGEPSQSNNNFKQFKLVYYYPGQGQVVNQEIKVNTDLSANINDQYFDEELKLEGMNADVIINGVEYSKLLLVSCPETVVVPDNRVELTLEPTTDGISITLPEEVAKYDKCRIYRKMEGIVNESDAICIFVFNFKNKVVINDSFVENNKTYEYSVGCGNQDIDDFKTKWTKVTATGGRGEISLNCSELKGKYDNGIMTLEPIPKISPVLNENETWQLGIGYTNPSRNWRCAFMDNSNGKIDYKTSYNNDGDESFIEKDLKISSIRIIVNTGDIMYHIDNVSNVSLAGLPQTIFVPSTSN